MVLESIGSVREAFRKPWYLFLISGIISVICLVISFLVFHQSVGLFTTFLITFALTPFMVNMLLYEEATTEKELEQRVGMNLLKRHADILAIYVALFTGMVFSLSIVYTLLPEPIIERMFEDQIREINIIRGRITFGGTFERIFLNNVSVLSLSFLFSFLFGSGAIFILSWNASVLATAIGMTAKSLGGVSKLPLAAMVFFPHGSLEIVAYFIGGIAGGIISASLTRRKSKWFHIILRDSLILLCVAVILLFFAGMIEATSIILSR